MTYVMRVVSLVGQVTGPGKHPAINANDKLYVHSFDLEAHHGRGWISTTSDLGCAYVWPDKESALLDYMRVPKSRPRRPDGYPNRPMTAFTVEILPLAEARAEDH